MRLQILLAALLTVASTEVMAQPWVLTPISPAAAVSNDRVGQSVSVSGVRAAIGAPFSDVGALDSGAAYIYVQNLIGWQSETRLTPDDPSQQSQFGTAVSISGDQVAIGAPREDRNSQTDLGSVYIFRRSAGAWVQDAKIVSPAPVANQIFGNAVFLRGNYLLIGAPGTSNRTGAVFFFEKVGSTWTYRQTLAPVAPFPGENFGQAISFDGTRAVVGIRQQGSEGTEPGRAYVYLFSGGQFLLQQVLSPLDGHIDDRFGVSVAIAGSTIAVGASGNNQGAINNGAGYVFTLQNGLWAQTAKVLPPLAQANQSAGASVSLGMGLLLGAPMRDLSVPDAGAVYAYRASGLSYYYTGSLQAQSPEQDDQFGSSLSFASKNALLVGAPKDNDRGADSGIAYGVRTLPVATTAARVIICEDPPNC